MSKDLYLVTHDREYQKIGLVDDFAKIEEVEPEYASFELNSSPFSPKSTALSYTAKYDRETYQHLHNIFSTAPCPRMKRNQKNKKNFNKFIKTTMNRRTKNGSRFHSI